MKRRFSPEQAERWSWEDTATVILSPLVYVLLLVGCALSLLLSTTGFLLLAVGIVLMLLMVVIIDPKLSAASRAYETKQRKYIEELEKKVRWEDTDGD